MQIKGGEAIAAGGFGCVFRPPLKCSSKKSTHNSSLKNNNMVSKLMIQKYGEEEYYETARFLDILEKIPKYEHYFLLPQGLCSPSALKSRDLINFDKKCNNLTRKNITSANVNEKLEKLRIIQLYDGGIDLEKYISKETMTNEKLLLINKQLVRLLKKAVIPMNHLGLYHFDLKASNIMMNEKNKTKIIDFGLSQYIEDFDEIPEDLTYRPCQYNLPATNILFNNEFIEEYINFLSKHPIPSVDEIYTFVYDLYYSTLESELGPGHFDFKKQVLRDYILEQPKMSKNIIFTYISENLHAYTQNGNFDITNLFKHFLHNADTYGLLMSYIDMIHQNGVVWLNNDLKKTMQSEIRMLLKKYIINSSYELIDKEECIQDIENLNSMILSRSSKKSIVTGKKIKHISDTYSANTSKVKLSIKLSKIKSITKQMFTKTLSVNQNNIRTITERASSRRKTSKKSTKRTSGKKSNSQTLRTNRMSNNKTKKRKRCPNGTRRNKKTGNCEPYNRK
jgi:hypothetical protein